MVGRFSTYQYPTYRKLQLFPHAVLLALVPIRRSTFHPSWDDRLSLAGNRIWTTVNYQKVWRRVSQKIQTRRRRPSNSRNDEGAQPPPPTGTDRRRSKCAALSVSTNNKLWWILFPWVCSWIFLALTVWPLSVDEGGDRRRRRMRGPVKVELKVPGVFGLMGLCVHGHGSERIEFFFLCLMASFDVEN